MQHWIIARSSIDCLVKDVRLVILRILARLNCMKFFITMDHLHFVNSMILRKFDVVRGNLLIKNGVIRKQFPLGINGQCMYRSGKSINLSGTRVTNLEYGISVDETSFVHRSNIRIYSDILIKPLIYTLSDGTNKLTVYVCCPAEIYELDVDVNHICIDVYKEL